MPKLPKIWDCESWPYVLVESPYESNEEYSIQDNIQYARECLLDCVALNEIPLVLHLMYPQVIAGDGQQGALRLSMSQQWILSVSKVAVYRDHGISNRMHAMIKFAEDHHVIVEYRNIHVNKGTVLP